jgi:hypothetical protein
LPVSLGQFAHQGEYCFQEYGLAKCIRQGVHPASTQGSHAINKNSDDITKDRTDDSEQEKTRNDADKLKQGENSKVNN